MAVCVVWKRIALLIESLLIEDHAEGVDRLRGGLCHEPHHGAAVDATTEERTKGHVAHHALLHGPNQSFTHFALHGLQWQLPGLRSCVGDRVPPSLLLHLACLPPKPVSRHQHAHVADDGGRGMHGLVANKVRERIGIASTWDGTAGEQGTQLTGENEVSVVLPQVDGLDAQAIAHQV
jgi:hypothetical protein